LTVRCARRAWRALFRDTPCMDGLLRAIGDGITGLLGGAFAAIGHALLSMVHAVFTVIPPALAPVLGIGLALLVLWLIFKR
jgi:hypothetical protein